MAVGGEDAIVRAQIFLDGLRLGGRFDDDELHGREKLSLRVRARVGSARRRRQAASRGVRQASKNGDAEDQVAIGHDEGASVGAAPFNA